MKNLAPEIMRQRLLIEGFFEIPVDERVIKKYFETICAKLGLRFYAEPIIFSPAGMGAEKNQGYDAFVPLIDSGISAYVWNSTKFVSVVIYTCKSFDAELAVQVTKDFFKVTQCERLAF